MTCPVCQRTDCSSPHGIEALTLADLGRLCEKYRDRVSIVVGVDEWERLSQYVAAAQWVAATPDRPAFFWFRDKKIVVTPAYMIAAIEAEAAHGR